MKPLHVAPGHFVPTREAEERCLRDYGFDRRHLYALMVVVAAWRADQLPVMALDAAVVVKRERGLEWADKCFAFLERRGYIRRAPGKAGKNGSATLWVPTTLALQLCPAPPAEEVAAE